MTATSNQTKKAERATTPGWSMYTLYAKRFRNDSTKAKVVLHVIAPDPESALREAEAVGYHEATLVGQTPPNTVAVRGVLEEVEAESHDDR